MADLLGIDRRINKNNENYNRLKMGIIPSTEIGIGGVEVRDARTAILLGVYEQGWSKKEIFPRIDTSVPGWWRYASIIGELEDKKDGYEKSMFNLSKYKFFLMADFSISDRCCLEMKKKPVHDYGRQTGRKPITAQMASESRLRTQNWLQNGCNGFKMESPISNPMSFWTEQDVLLYIKKYNIPICSVYGDVVFDYKADGQVDGQMTFSELEIDTEGMELFDAKRPPLKTTGCSRTGCVLCGFGCHLESEEEARFVRLKETHPKLYGLLDVIQNNGVTYREAIDWINENGGNIHIPY